MHQASTWATSCPPQATQRVGRSTSLSACTCTLRSSLGRNPRTPTLVESVGHKPPLGGRVALEAEWPCWTATACCKGRKVHFRDAEVPHSLAAALWGGRTRYTRTAQAQALNRHAYCRVAYQPHPRRRCGFVPDLVGAGAAIYVITILNSGVIPPSCTSPLYYPVTTS